MYEVVHKKWKRKFQIEKEGLKAKLRYRFRGNNVMELLRTEVPDEWRGKGIGKQLIDAAIDFARSHRYSVKPSCSYIQNILEKNHYPEVNIIVEKK